MAKDAVKRSQHMAALHALTIAKNHADAAKIIEEQAKKSTLLKHSQQLQP